MAQLHSDPLADIHDLQLSDTGTADNNLPTISLHKSLQSRHLMYSSDRKLPQVQDTPGIRSVNLKMKQLMHGVKP